MRKVAVVLFGSPGSGKGMQADLLADRLGLIHFDSGKLLRAILSDESVRTDPILKRERKLNDAGILNTPSWVLRIFKERVRLIAKMGYGVAFSGSPRTLYEAEGFIPFLEKLYGRKNVYVFALKVPLATAARRNRLRLVCATCRRPLLLAFYPTKNPRRCPVCAGVLIRRTDDDPAKFKTRAAEYETRTKPVVEYVRRRGYRITVVNGAPAPYKIFEKISKVIH